MATKLRRVMELFKSLGPIPRLIDGAYTRKPPNQVTMNKINENRVKHRQTRECNPINADMLGGRRTRGAKDRNRSGYSVKALV